VADHLTRAPGGRVIKTAPCSSIGNLAARSAAPVHCAPNGAMAAPSMRPLSIFRDRGGFHPTASLEVFQHAFFTSVKLRSLRGVTKCPERRNG
jgi:hypothetical protein